MNAKRRYVAQQSQIDSSTDRTLYFRRPYGRTLALTLLLLALLMALGEVLVRTEVFEGHVVANNRGGRHRQFELQLGRLETVVARDGPIDCIALGSSMVWYDFDPEAFSEGYQHQTGQEIRCFNFGVDGLPAASAGALAPILAGDFQPSLLIYGTTARDYAVPKESENNTVLLEMPWLRYRLGQFSIQGWFYEHSRLYRYWETLGHLLRLENRHLLMTGYYASLKDNYGFSGREGVGTLGSVPLDPQSEDPRVRRLFELLYEYEILPENLTGLDQVMAQNSREVQVVLVEMPVPPAYLHFFGHGRQDYQRFINQVESMAESRTVPFWQTTHLRLIPDDAWFDYVYPNTKGARIFSAWLGEQVGSAVIQEKLEDPVEKH